MMTTLQEAVVQPGADPGRVCPLRYRYGARAIAACPPQPARTLYVIGGLYGNRAALDAILALAAAEPGPVRLCFNGDFNWFNVDHDGFAAINEAVLAHDATLGNVEAELFADDAGAGCGCAYPDTVEAAVVERSNRIHARLKRTAAGHPRLLARLSALPMVRRYEVGGARIGVVHGDADALAGWRFDGAALDDDGNLGWLEQAFMDAEVDVFASSHTCLPALRVWPGEGRARAVVNNGAAGMPNFRGTHHGVITRIGVAAAPGEILYGTRLAGVHVDALAVPYDTTRWMREFLANWPPGSDAHASYHARIMDGPAHGLDAAAGRHAKGITDGAQAYA